MCACGSPDRRVVRFPVRFSYWLPSCEGKPQIQNARTDSEGKPSLVDFALTGPTFAADLPGGFCQPLIPGKAADVWKGSRNEDDPRPAMDPRHYQTDLRFQQIQAVSWQNGPLFYYGSPDILLEYDAVLIRVHTYQAALNPGAVPIDTWISYELQVACLLFIAGDFPSGFFLTPI